MMNCQELKQWLNSQDSTDARALQQISDHVQMCQACEALFQADKTLDEMLKEGMQPVEPPSNLITRARNRIESEDRPQPFGWLSVSWKMVLPAVTMAALVLVLLNPFSAHLKTVDEMVKHSISNHRDTGMQMAFQAEEVGDIGQWFTQRLGYTVPVPDLKRLGLNLVGGRECAFGKIDAALLFCKSKGKRASLFMIDQNDVGIHFDGDRKYIIEEGNYKVSIWKDAGIVYAMVI
jgi:anti-sigma factor RsiW